MRLLGEEIDFVLDHFPRKRCLGFVWGSRPLENLEAELFALFSACLPLLLGAVEQGDRVCGNLEKSLQTLGK